MGIIGVQDEIVLPIGEHLSIPDLAHFLSTCRELHYTLIHTLYKRGNVKDGQTALHWAAECGDIFLVELAISRGAEIDKPNKSRSYRTALHSATEENHSDIIHLLIKKGTRPSAKDANGSTPQHMAALCEILAATSALLELGAEIMCRRDNGATPAHYSATEFRNRAPSGLPLFINAGFDPNTRGFSDRTVLHVAALYGSFNIMGYLLWQKMVGVPIKARDSSGKAPLDYVWDPDALTSADAAQAGISRLLTAATEQVEGGRDHTCLHGCYHRFSL